MEILYSTSTKNTYEEFKRFSWEYVKRSKKFIALFIFFELMMAFLAVLCKDAIFAIGAIIYPFAIVFAQNRQIKKVFNSNKLLQNVETRYDFYADFFTAQQPNGNSKVEYNQLYKIMETKSNFYLMIAQNQGYIVKKQGGEDDLAEFLRSKAVFANAKKKGK